MDRKVDFNISLCFFSDKIRIYVYRCRTLHAEIGGIFQELKQRAGKPRHGAVKNRRFRRISCCNGNFIVMHTDAQMAGKLFDNSRRYFHNQTNHMQNVFFLPLGPLFLLFLFRGRFPLLFLFLRPLPASCRKKRKPHKQHAQPYPDISVRLHRDMKRYRKEKN